MGIDEISRFIGTVGFPIAVFLLFLLGGWRVLKWVGWAFENHVVPLINDHRELMNELREYVQEQRSKPDATIEIRNEMAELKRQVGQLECLKR